MNTLVAARFTRRATALLFAALAVASTGQLDAQTAVSNFGQGSGGTANIGFAFNGATERRVFSFTTGASVGGYEFTSFTLAFTGTTGSPGSLAVGLYSAFDSSNTSSPTGLVANLSLTSGNLTSVNSAVFSGSATLAASTSYYLLLSAPSASTSGNYYTYRTSGTLNEDSGGLAGWTIGDAGYYGLGGNTWNSAGGGAMMSIQASAIPEPSTYAAIMGLGALGFVVWRRQRSPSPVTRAVG
ncbi:MAG: PEP-CTERM sorting domain-containing protein [Verrucomicrobia bacterium]|nr:PEP-CTERM sorting domain-containing protein [Verrucomicrobiota bacterium]